MKKISDNLISYNWKFEIIVGKKKINVSRKISSYISEKNILEIKNTVDISKFIQNEKLKSKTYYWKISNKYNRNWMPITILGGIPFTLDLNTKLKNKFLNIVYFINSDISSCYRNLMADQIDSLIDSKILNSKKTKLYFVIICSDLIKRKEIQDLINLKKIKDFTDYECFFSNDQHKEYEGINKVWSLSNINPNEDELILYMHAKGISYMQNKLFYIRQPLERFIFKLLIKQWERNIELITRFNSIYKIGTLSGGNGWLWFNFWIAKSIYITRLEKPVKRNRACYYEDWLGRYLIKNKNQIHKKYINEYDEEFENTINNTLSLLSKPSKNKFNIGTPCKVEKGGFVGLGIIKLKYRLWYYSFVILNKLGINNGSNDRFRFY